MREIYAYLSDRAQVTVVGSFYGEILDIISGVPKDSILYPLFNIYIIVFFFRAVQIRFFKLCRFLCADNPSLIIVGTHFERHFRPRYNIRQPF